MTPLHGPPRVGNVAARGGEERLRGLESVVYRNGVYRERSYVGSGNALVRRELPTNIEQRAGTPCSLMHVSQVFVGDGIGTVARHGFAKALYGKPLLPGHQIRFTQSGMGPRSIGM